jgi:hypothetical protein
MRAAEMRLSDSVQREEELTRTVEKLTDRLKSSEDKVSALVVSGSMENGKASDVLNTMRKSLMVARVEADDAKHAAGDAQKLLAAARAAENDACARADRIRASLAQVWHEYMKQFETV